MSDDLEAIMRRAIKSGLLRFSLHENWSDDKNRKGKWSASYMHVESNLIHYVDGDDPIECFKKAIKVGEADAKGRRESRLANVPYEKAVRGIQQENRATIREEEIAEASRLARRRRDRDSLA